VKKILNIGLSVAVTLAVWLVVRSIWSTTVRFADIFGDTGGEDMALGIGLFWIGIPAISFARLVPSAGFSTRRWVVMLVLTTPFFIAGFLTCYLPIHELAVDAVQGKHLYWSHVVSLQLILWIAAILPFSALIGISSDESHQHFHVNKAPA
jgi:hypothetical protein